MFVQENGSSIIFVKATDFWDYRGAVEYKSDRFIFLLVALFTEKMGRIRTRYDM